jgi:hypothetical protein
MEGLFKDDFEFLCPAKHAIPTDCAMSFMTNAEVNRYHAVVLLKRDDYVSCPKCNHVGAIRLKACCDKLYCSRCPNSWYEPRLTSTYYPVIDVIAKFVTSDSDALSNWWKEVWTKRCPNC